MLEVHDIGPMFRELSKIAAFLIISYRSISFLFNALNLKKPLNIYKNKYNTRGDPEVLCF